MNALSFFRMETDEISEWYIAPCFVNGLEAYDGEVNLEFDDNLISNEFAIKLCLDYEVKKGKKLVKKELIVALKGELYFVKFTINPEEDDFKPGVILGRPFIPNQIRLRLIMRKQERAQTIGNNYLISILMMYQNIGPSSSAGGHLTQEEAAKEALAIRISQKYALLEEERPVIETMAFNDKYKMILDEIWKDKEKDDPGAFIFPIRLEGKVNENALADTGFDVLRIAESDSNDEEEYVIKRNKFGAPIYGLKPAPYLNCTNPEDRASAIQAVTNPFWKINVWKKAVSFLGSLPVPLKLQEHMIMKPDRYDPNAQDNTKQWKKHIYSPCVVNWDILNRMGCDGEIDDMLRIKVREAESGKEIFTSVAWIRAFNINEPIYAEFCHEFYSTYEFEVCASDELQTNKIIKFRLGGRAHSLTLLEFARRLGLYQATELDEGGFNVYFEGGLQSDEHFNVQETNGYDKIQKNDLWLLSMFDARHQNGYANVAWLIARWMKRKGAGTQRESQICCGQFITKLARKTRVLTDDVIRSSSAPIYCRDLDTTTLRELIDSEGRLILEDPQPGVPRVGIPRLSMCRELGYIEPNGSYGDTPGDDKEDGGAYNPPAYAQPQYDQYYQQYPPPPP
ncbi:hypothetical protein Tco_0260541 [Tanacetum coccineum]